MSGGSSTEGTAKDEAGNDDFKKYMLSEYENIAEAHFRTIAAISSFFRYYLVLMALPVTLTGVFIGLSSKEEISSIMANLRIPVSGITLIISAVGLLVLLYVVNLRMDVILYARVVNAIRKYFYDDARIDVNAKLRLRVLPQTPFVPGYREWAYFFPVVLSFAIFNTFYYITALTLAPSPDVNISWNGIPILIWLGGGSFFGLHIVAYLWFSDYREHSYLRSYALGVDIDGVLNKHRPHFCGLLKETVGKTLDPRHITIIPLHDDPVLGITRGDEASVFNDPRYWTLMPAMDGAADNIKRLRNAFKIRIHIFSSRPWPRIEAEVGTGILSCSHVHLGDRHAICCNNCFKARQKRACFKSECVQVLVQVRRPRPTWP